MLGMRPQSWQADQADLVECCHDNASTGEAVVVETGDAL
jgi:hypothetical protein